MKNELIESPVLKSGEKLFVAVSMYDGVDRYAIRATVLDFKKLKSIYGNGNYGVLYLCKVAIDGRILFVSYDSNFDYCYKCGQVGSGVVLKDKELLQLDGGVALCKVFGEFRNGKKIPSKTSSNAIIYLKKI